MADLRLFGASEEVVAAWSAKAVADQDFELFEDCEWSLRVFTEMRTQWDRAGMDGTRVGLKYEVLPQFMRRLSVPPELRQQIWEDVRVLEEATLQFDKERAK